MDQYSAVLWPDTSRLSVHSNTCCPAVSLVAQRHLRMVCRYQPRCHSYLSYHGSVVELFYKGPCHTREQCHCECISEVGRTSPPRHEYRCMECLANMEGDPDHSACPSSQILPWLCGQYRLLILHSGCHFSGTVSD